MTINSNYRTSITTGYEEIEQVDEINYLGVIIDKDLNFNSQVFFMDEEVYIAMSLQVIHQIKNNMRCCYSERLINKLLILHERAKDKIDIGVVKKAIYFAKKYHGDQKRQSGEAYYSHPLEVAYMISDYLFRTDIIVTSILHDTIEDTELTKEMIAKSFTEIIASQVEDLTRIKEDGKISSAEMVERLYKEKKKDVLLVKLFDRLQPQLLCRKLRIMLLSYLLLLILKLH